MDFKRISLHAVVLVLFIQSVARGEDTFNVPTINVYLTVLPYWTVNVGTTLNFTCSSDTTLTNDVLYLALITNTSITNIVQVSAASPQPISISTVYSNRIQVYMNNPLNTVVFTVTNVMYTDSGLYLCYIKSAYSTLSASDTVTISVSDLGFTGVSDTTTGGVDSVPTEDYSTTIAVETETSSDGMSTTRLALIIATVCCGVVALAVVILVPILVMRHRRKRRSMERRLQVMEISRQQSLEDQSKVHLSSNYRQSATANGSASSIPVTDSVMFSRQGSSESDAYLADSGQQSKRELSSNNVYLEPPCVVSKTQILNNATREHRSTSYAPVPSTSSRPQRVSHGGVSSPLGASASAGRFKKYNAAPVGLVVESAARAPHKSSHSIVQPGASTSLSMSATHIMTEEPPLRATRLSLSQQMLPQRHDRPAWRMAPHLVSNRMENASPQLSKTGAGFEKAELPMATMSSGAGCSGLISPPRLDKNAPPSYNQILLSNEAVALFGDSVRVPLRANIPTVDLSHSLPSNSQFVANELYSVTMPVSQHGMKNGDV